MRQLCRNCESMDEARLVARTAWMMELISLRNRKDRATDYVDISLNTMLAGGCERLAASYLASAANMAAKDGEADLVGAAACGLWVEAASIQGRTARGATTRRRRDGAAIGKDYND